MGNPHIDYLRDILDGVVEVEENPLRIKYIVLEDLLDFKDFEYTLWWVHEKTILQPQLEDLGYTDVTWTRGETDSFGPLTRLCHARDQDGAQVWFIYG